MARIIVQQPNKLFCIWSTVADDFITTDLTEQEVSDMMVIVKVF